MRTANAETVLDATVVAALYLDDPLSNGSSIAIGRLQAAGSSFHAPDLLVHEISNAFWKAARREELSTDDCLDRVAAVISSEIELHSGREIARPAMALSLAHGISAYDAAYLALALRLDATLITGDQPFARRAAATGVSIELVEAQRGT